MMMIIIIILRIGLSAKIKTFHTFKVSKNTIVMMKNNNNQKLENSYYFKPEQEMMIRRIFF